jgi:hypothetical protein
MSHQGRAPWRLSGHRQVVELIGESGRALAARPRSSHRAPRFHTELAAYLVVHLCDTSENGVASRWEKEYVARTSPCPRLQRAIPRRSRWLGSKRTMQTEDIPAAQWTTGEDKSTVHRLGNEKHANPSTPTQARTKTAASRRTRLTGPASRGAFVWLGADRGSVGRVGR